MKSVSGVWAAAGLLACWLLLGLLSYVPDDVQAGIALVWLPSGLALGVAGAASASRLPWLLAASGLGAFFFSLGQGMPVSVAILECSGEILAILAGAMLLRASRQWAEPRLRWLGQVGACALTAMVSATTFVLAWLLAGESLPWLTTWTHAAVGVWVGGLLVTPLVLSFSDFRARRSGGMTMLKFGSGGLAYVGFLIFASLVFQGDVSERFGQSLGPTLTYLPLALLVLAALIWGERGGLLAIAVGAALMIGWTALGLGPFAANEGFPGEALLEVQAYVAVIALLAGLMQALQARTAQALEESGRWRLRYLQVLESGGFATLSMDAVGGACDWSENASSFLGGAPDRDVMSLIARADPAVQPMMRAQWQSLVQGAQLSASWDWPDGIRADLSAVQGPDGRVELITALLRRDRRD